MCIYSGLYSEIKILNNKWYVVRQKELEVPGKTPEDKEAIVEDLEMETRPEEGTRFHVRQSKCF